QLSRIEGAVSSDPELAIGSAKELIETCCKTILDERGIAIRENTDMSELVKATLKELKLTRDDIPDSRQGAETIRRIVSNLGSIASSVNDLRNWYGTGHGRTGNRTLSPRHAQLVVGSASTLVQFLFDTHNDQASKSGPSH
ncbi:MAG: abortive infection family protein, partial [Chloroflexi bacterium]|nr:abortive infection family protein [Chloroflexota bacterium]